MFAIGDGVAKAQVTTPGGITVKIEGTPQEILALVRDLERKDTDSAEAKIEKKPRARATLTGLLDSLLDDGFFKEPRDLGAIRSELVSRGHHYPVTTLSGAVLGKVRKRLLRRLKKDNRWLYTR